MKLRNAWTALFVCTAAVPAGAGTLKAPSSKFATIQAALDVATAGDVVEVAKGHHRERLVIVTQGVELRGSGASIDAEYLGPCVQVLANDVKIRGLILRNGDTGIEAKGDRVRIEDNEIRAPGPYGVRVEGDDALIEDNEILGCQGDFIHILTDTNASVTRIEDNRLEYGEGSQLIDATGGQFIVRGNVGRAHDSGFHLRPTHPTKSSKIEDNLFEALDSEAIKLLPEGAGAIVRKNVMRGLYGPGIRVEVEKETKLIRLRDNLVDGCGSSGIDVVAVAPSSIVIERNQIRRGANDGIYARGSGIVLVENEIDLIEDDGMYLTEFAGLVKDNRVERTGGDGIDLDSTSGPVELAGNRVSRAAFDGIEVSGAAVLLVGNESTGNLGDGIVLRSATDCRLLGNECSKNEHEGIDNDGTGTVIDGNECFKNGGGFGPDIAGKGEGAGTVASFAGNDFGSGGANVLQRLDQ